LKRCRTWVTFVLGDHTHLEHTQFLALWRICYLRHMFPASLYSMGMDQVGHTSAKERCCLDDLAELIQRRGCGLMSFLLLMSCKLMFSLSLCVYFLIDNSSIHLFVL
jgi:hypothetical protein